MKNHLIRLMLWVLLCGHFPVWAGINEDLLAAAKAGKSTEVERLLDAYADVAAQDTEGYTPLHWAAYSGDRKAVELLIAHHANVNARCRSGCTPLHMAAYWGYKEIAQVLLEHGAEINVATTGGYTPLFKAIEPLQAVYTTEDEGILPNLAPEEALANKELVALLLAKGAQVKVKAKDGSTPLHFAAVLGVPDIVELLLASGAEVNAKGPNGVTPLYLAARFDRKEVAETLLAHGANIEAQTRSGYTPLTMGAENGNSTTVEVLLRHGANSNIKDKQGVPLLLQLLRLEMKIYSLNSPLFANRFTPAERAELNKARKAVKGEWPAVVKLLVEYGADVNAVHGGDTPLYIAATMGDSELVELLLSKGAYANGDISGAVIETPLHSAIAEKHLKVAESLINHGANVNALNMSKRTPLHFLASFVKDGKLAELMIAKGADVNAPDKNGETPYDFAIRSGNQEVATVLKQQATKASGKALSGMTMDDLNHLLESGVALDQQLPNGSTLLIEGVVIGNKAMVERLLDIGANVNVKDKIGTTPLRSAFSVPMLKSPLGSALTREVIAAGQLTKDAFDATQKMQGQWREVALLLISKGADVNVNGPGNGMTPLHCAAMVDYRDVAEMLLSKGAAINAREVQNRTPLHLSIMAGHTGMVRLLLTKGADIHALGAGGETSLHLAVASRQDENGKKHGSKEIAELLISRGASVNAKTELGKTPLHLAAVTGEAEIAKLLIAKGAEVNALDKQSHTPLFYATEQGNTDVAKILIQHGGTK